MNVLLNYDENNNIILNNYIFSMDKFLYEEYLNTERIELSTLLNILLSFYEKL